MFEENKTNQPIKEPKDIFAQTEKEIARPATEKPKEVFDFGERKPSIGKKLIIIIVALLVIAGLVYVAFLGFSKLQQQAEEKKEQADSGSENVNQPAETEVKVPVVAKDSDGDGLSDQEEISLGTSIEKVDSDGDGLSDREEVRVYKTDPLKPDTDADGYLDGQEVRANYDPNNPAKGAKLMDLRAEMEKLK